MAGLATTPGAASVHTQRIQPTKFIVTPSTPAFLSLKRPGCPSLQLCRVTNSGDEMRVPELYEQMEDGKVRISQYQIPDPELGPLERRVSLTYEDALFQDEISIEDMDYWFTEPQGGWNQEARVLEVLPEIPNELSTAKNFGEGRTRLGEVHSSMELTGTVNRVMLHHGAQVDLGAEYDGLIPITNEQWEGMCDVVCVGTRVVVRVHKVVDPVLHRWPIQLQLLSPEPPVELTPPEQWESPMDLRYMPQDLEATCEKTGRAYQPYKYWLSFFPSDAQQRFDSFAGEEDEYDTIGDYDDLSTDMEQQLVAMSGDMDY